MLRITALSLILILGSAATSAQGVPATKVFGPEIPGRYKHPASFTELDDGGLYLVYYGGDGEYEDDSKVWGSRLAKGARVWTPPRVVADTPTLPEGNPVVWQAPDGLVWLFYVQRYGETWSTSRIKAKTSPDRGETWSDSFILAFEQGMMVRSRPIALRDGDYLLGVYHETGHDTEKVGNDTSSLFLRYSSDAKTWTQTNKIYSRIGNLQPTPVQITDEYLVSYSRRGGDYGPTTDGYLVRSESRDGGRTWSPGEDSAFPNPNSATDFIRLRNGHLLLVYNDSMTSRAPLTAAISVDDDESYPYRLNIAEGQEPFAYPVVLQGADDRIHVVYTTKDRSTIMHAVFDEALILEQPR